MFQEDFDRIQAGQKKISWIEIQKSCILSNTNLGITKGLLGIDPNRKQRHGWILCIITIRAIVDGATERSSDGATDGPSPRNADPKESGTLNGISYPHGSITQNSRSMTENGRASEGF